LAVAITNAQRLGDEASLLEATSPLYRLAHRIATTRTEREIYIAMLEPLRDFNPTRAFVFRTEDDPAAAYIAAEMRGGELNFHEQRFMASNIQYIGDLVASSANIESPLLLSSLGTAPTGLADVDALLAQLATELGVLGIVIVPLRIESNFLGTLLVTYDTPHKFTSLQAQLYRVLADMSGVALERTMLVRQAESRLERERWIREFGEHVMRIPDLETVLVQSTELLQNAVQADSILVSLLPPDEG
jgi:GAF domain-containing protein